MADVGDCWNCGAALEVRSSFFPSPLFLLLPAPLFPGCVADGKWYVVHRRRPLGSRVSGMRSSELKGRRGDAEGGVSFFACGRKVRGGRA